MSSTVELLRAYQDARVVVLGAAGFIGRWVARRLAPARARIWLVVRDRESAGPLLAEAGAAGDIIPVDLRRDAELERLVREARPAVVFNLAGYGVDRGERDADLATRLNQDLPRRLAECLLTARDPGWTGPALVHAGSALEYGEAEGDLSEDTVPRPTTVYGATKLGGTRAIEAAAGRGLKAVTARIFTAYGPGEHPGRLLPTLLSAAGTSERIPLSDGTQQRDFTFVGDVADGFLRLGAHHGPVPATLNLATGVLTSVRRFVEIAAEVLGIEPGRLGFGDLPRRMEEMGHRAVNLARLRNTLGWQPNTAPREGIRLTAEILGTPTEPD